MHSPLFTAAHFPPDMHTKCKCGTQDMVKGKHEVGLSGFGDLRSKLSLPLSTFIVRSFSFPFTPNPLSVLSFSVDMLEHLSNQLLLMGVLLTGSEVSQH